MSDDEKASWAERAQQGAMDSLEFIKETGGEWFKGALTVTGVATLATAGASAIGIELQGTDGAKLAVAAVFVGYKVYSAIKKYRENKQADELKGEPSDADALETISIEDYRDLQKNMDRILGSHDVLVTALSESEKANRHLHKANDELVKANHDLRNAMGNYYRIETQTAEDMGVLERRDWQYDESESVVSRVDVESGQEHARTVAELYQDEPEDTSTLR